MKNVIVTNLRTTEKIEMPESEHLPLLDVFELKAYQNFYFDLDVVFEIGDVCLMNDREDNIVYCKVLDSCVRENKVFYTFKALTNLEVLVAIHKYEK